MDDIDCKETECFSFSNTKPDKNWPCLFVLLVTKTDPCDPEIVLLAISIIFIFISNFFSEINKIWVNQIINVAIYLYNRKGITNKWNNAINSKKEHSVFFSSVQFFCFLLL